MKKILSILLNIALISLLSGCGAPQSTQPTTNLVYYKLYENEENLRPLFDNFKKVNPNVNIIYKNFTDPEEYYSTIINEIAEGRGPDIMSVHNTWVSPNFQKLTPAPTELVSPEDYRNIFVNQASQDNILQINNQEQVFGIPLHTDSLALYYNQKQFEQSLPESGKPSPNWNEFKKQISILNIEGKRTGLSIGTGEDILRSHDIFYQLVLQNQKSIYNSPQTKANLEQTTPVLDFITNFNTLQSNNQSQYKEIEAFLTGQTSSIFGYSFLYKDLIQVQKQLQKQGKTTIDIQDIKITTSPQLDPANPVAYANYFTEVVSRNSKNSQLAWQLLGFMSSQENLNQYYKQNFKVTSRRNMITNQKQNRIYGPFLEQIGLTQSFPIQDEQAQKQIIKELIDSYPTNTTQAITTANQKINKLIPNSGLKPN